MLEIINYLKQGGILVYPTETAYALGCDATNARAVRRIFKIKHRPLTKTLPLIAGSLAMVKRFCKMSMAEERLARRYWAGPLTMILDIKDIKILDIRILASGVIAKNNTIAIRVSSNKIAQNLSRRLGRPLVSTSANLSGTGECYSVREVEGDLKIKDEKFAPKAHPPLAEKILVIDGGRLKKRKPSTIVRVGDRGEKIILRQGEVKL